MQILTQVKYFSAVLANKIPKKIFFSLMKDIMMITRSLNDKTKMFIVQQ